MQKISPYLWFSSGDDLEAALNLYTTVFDNAMILNMNRLSEGGPGGNGAVLTGTFELEGQTFMALNGGPTFKFTPAISFFVHCYKEESSKTFY